MFVDIFSTNKKYQIIYADPPWKYYSDRPCFEIDPITHNRGGASSKYSTMSLANLAKLPIANLTSDTCALFLWATFPKLPEACTIIGKWGFDYKTCAFVWIKTNVNSMGLFWGMGRYTRANAELCLLATKAIPKRISASVHQVIMSPVQKHSRKPVITRDLIIQLLGDLPRIELFARYEVNGWDCWGDEVGETAMAKKVKI